MTIAQLIEKCRRQQEEYLIKKNEEPVQLSLFQPHIPTKEEIASAHAARIERELIFGPC